MNDSLQSIIDRWEGEVISYGAAPVIWDTENGEETYTLFSYQTGVFFGEKFVWVLKFNTRTQGFEAMREWAAYFKQHERHLLFWEIIWGSVGVVASDNGAAVRVQVKYVVVN